MNDASKPVAILSITCAACEAKTEVHILSCGPRFMNHFVSFCPRCGSRDIEVVQRWD